MGAANCQDKQAEWQRLWYVAEGYLVWRFARLPVCRPCVCSVTVYSAALWAARLGDLWWLSEGCTT